MKTAVAYILMIFYSQDTPPTVIHHIAGAEACQEAGEAALRSSNYRIVYKCVPATQ